MTPSPKKKLRAVVAEHESKYGKKKEKDAPDEAPSPGDQIKILVTPWFRYFLVYDPRPALRRVTCPVLVLNGEKDLQVEAKVHLNEIEAALQQGQNKDFTIKVLPNLNHLFQTCKTGAVTEYGAIEETIAPVVLETIAEWITKRTGQPATPPTVPVK